MMAELPMHKVATNDKISAMPRERLSTAGNPNRDDLGRDCWWLIRVEARKKSVASASITPGDASDRDGMS